MSRKSTLTNPLGIKHETAGPLSPIVEKEIGELLKLYRAARTRIEKQISRAALTDFQEYRANDQLRQIKAIIAALNAEIEPRAKRIATESLEVGYKLSHAVLASQGASAKLTSHFGNMVNTYMVEAFADSVTGLIFDGQTLRIEFGVTRFDDAMRRSPAAVIRLAAWCCRRSRPSISSIACNRSRQR